jgi:2-polyprenyl-3-methyl-5-hydroxy-6-metoxy-1,4-benzoquinol methylase
MGASPIRTQPHPHCPVCGSAGKLLYANQTDRIYHVPGLWNVRQCQDSSCGTLWLDPWPIAEDLPKLYAEYYTHRSVPTASSGLRALLKQTGVAYLHARYGYPGISPAWKQKLFSLLPHLHPFWKDMLAASVFYLSAHPGGRLLEVGCGSGATLHAMQQRGWQVTGLDFDANAVANARSKGLDVHHGQLADQAFPDNSFDAVVMSHVIEHVPNPRQLLIECRRILKPNGTLVVLTPNAGSALHRRYGKNWRGLEIPRHLQLFTAASVDRMAKNIGFSVVKAFSSMNGYIYQELASQDLAKSIQHIMGGHVPFSRRFASYIKAFCAGWWRTVCNIQNNEEATLICKK